MTKGKKILLIMASVLLVCMVAFGILWGIKDGKLDNILNTLGIHKNDNDNASDEEIEAEAADEATLRELLAADANIKIQFTDELEVDEGFIVNGTKTLTGNGTLRMSLGAELGQALLKVTKNSSLTLDGPTLDGNFNSDGIRVEKKATLTSLSGTIIYAGAYGILTYGDVTIKNIHIEDCEYISLCAQTGSKVYIEGGSIQRSVANDVYLVSGAYVNISGNTVMEGADQHGMINYGTLEINGGKFGNVNNYLCDNYGELTVEYKGEAANGQIEFYNARNSIFLMRKDSVGHFSDVYIHDTQRQAIASLGGDTYISDCTFENTGSHGIDIQAGEATIENVVVTGSKGSGLEASGGSEVTIKNFTVKDCEKIGIASRGAKITASKVDIKGTGRYGISCGDTKAGQGIISVEDAKIQNTTMHGVYVYEEGEAELKNIQVSGGEARGMYVAKTANCKLSGDSSMKNMAKGGIEVRGNLQIDSVVICDNHAKNSGAGIYVADNGVVTMNGGSVYNNTSELRGGGVCVTDGNITINGGKIYNNKSVNNGGGLYVQNTSVVNLNSGEISKNKSESGGNGIYVASTESKVTMGENFYLGGNDVKLQGENSVLNISGNDLKKHSASDPLLLTPNYTAAEGTQVAVCKNDTVSSRISGMVKSGDGSYSIIRDSKYFAILYTTADMNMAGADTVYVSNFQQLKEAVLSTTSKRYIVLKANIPMEERLRLPGGVTICIKDDGTRRTLTRAAGFTDSFFVTHYGTGLYLTGTAAGKLVLDGGYTAGTDDVKNQTLVRVSGSTELRNVILQNNGSLSRTYQVRGGLLRQLYGDFKIYDSVLSGGHAYSGGAIMMDQGEGYMEGTTLQNNESTIGGGAVRAAGGCGLEIVTSTFSGNHAGSTGGGIVALESSSVTVTNTKFENNTAANYGGAITIQDDGTKLSLNGTDSASAIFKNNSSKVAGAIYAVTKAQLEVTGYTFESNQATSGRAGAIAVLSNASANLTDTAFYANKATASGGAIVADTSKLQVVSCAFGKESAGNEAGDKGGAILITGSSVANMKAADGGKYDNFGYNTASGYGGAIFVNEGSTATLSGYTVEGNKGSAGGAIYVAAGGTVTGTNNRFEKNAANSGGTYGNGGAIYCVGVFKDTGSSYYGNEARNGGAIITMSGGKAFLDGTEKAEMNENIANATGGGAVYTNIDSEVTVTGYLMEGNKGAAGGAIYIAAGGTVNSANNQFERNIATSGNGGAVYCTGVFTDNDSNYQENEARNGGAIIVMSGGNATLDGTASQAVMKGNKVSVNDGAAVYVNGGGTATITGYALEGNAGAKDGSIQIVASGVAELNSIRFNGKTGKKVFVAGSLTFSDLSGVILVDNGSATEFVVSGYQDGNEVEFTPYAYASKVVLKKAEQMSDEDFEAACGAITVTPSSDGKYWYIDKDGMLVSEISNPVASVTVGDTTENFTDFSEAVAYANEKGGVGNVAPVKIVVLENTSINGKLEITKNITILNDAGKEITISRASNDAYDMFVVAENAALTLGTNDASETGTLIIDGTTSSAIAGRTVSVAAGGAFTLAKNAALQNANSTANGAAIQTASTKTFIYGTIQNNVTTGYAAVEVMTGGYATISGATFSENQAKAAPGAIYIGTGAEVVCDNTMYSGNKTTGITNAGAIYCAGTYTDTDSSYIGNEAKNGGAIFVPAGGKATLTGTDKTKAIFKENKATGSTTNDSRGGAIFMNGGSISITGYTFEGNTSTGTNANTGEGAVHGVAGSSVNLTDATFQGTTTQKIYILGSLTFSNLSGKVLIKAAGSAASFAVSGPQEKDVVEFTPYAYESKVVLKKADETSEEDFKSACSAISVTPSSDGKNWRIDETGTLVESSAASVTVGGTTEYFMSFMEAMDYANEKGGTGEMTPVEVVVQDNVSISETLEITKNITILNASGKKVTISRASDDAYDMLVVAENATLTLGTNDASETGTLIIDGATTSAIAGRTVSVATGATFTLAKNAILQNANSKVTGAAIQTASAKTFVYGIISNNITEEDAAGLDAQKGAYVTINGAIFSGNQAKKAPGALCIRAGAEVVCENATFSENKTTGITNAGAVYCAGIYTDTNSSYIGNEAKNGGAIFVPAGGKVTLTGTDKTKAIFKENKATGSTTNDSRGGAIFMNGGSISVTGYIFENNTSTGTNANTGEGAVHGVAGSSVNLTDATFQGTTTQKIYILGSLTFSNLSGKVLIKAAGSAASFAVSGPQEKDVVEFTPYAYESKVVLKKADGISEEDFKAACGAIIVTGSSDGKNWHIDETGTLVEGSAVSMKVTLKGVIVQVTKLQNIY